METVAIREKEKNSQIVRAHPEKWTILPKGVRLQRMAEVLVEGLVRGHDRDYVAGRMLALNPDLQDNAETRAELRRVVVEPWYNLTASRKGNPGDDPPVMKSDRDEMKSGAYKYEPVEGGTLFVNGVSANDIDQGAIGDCYFMASLAALADSNPTAIQKMIKDNGDGTYTVHLYKKGKPVSVTVDGDLPQKTDSGQLLYSSSTQKGELWVSLIEKAYAKLKGGYQKIGKGGWSYNALGTLTGTKGTNYKHKYKSTDKLWELISGAVQENRPVTASTNGKDKKKHEAIGLVANHAYTVVDAVEEDGQRYVVLRNPWADTEWNGGGSDGVNDGVFKVPIEEYKKLFTATDISKNTVH